MGKSPYEKWLTVGIILLFVGVTIAPAIAQNTEKSQSTSRGTWLYVGGGGPGNYTRIQDAIDNASEGDTIFVYHGTYYETLSINALTLIGEDRNTTTIDGGGSRNVIHIGSEVNIQGFTVKNTDTHHSGDAAFFIAGDNITISNNVITECSYGFCDQYEYGGQVEIFNNIFLNITHESILFVVYIWEQDTSYSIHDNYFYSNHIAIRAVSGRSVSIEHNHFEENDIGVDSQGSHAIINHNNFINNDIPAQFLRAWFFFFMETPMYYKPSFSENYWDDWEKTTPRPIRGTFWFLMMRWLVILGIIPGYYPFFPFIFPFLLQYDRHPAQEPYDIPGMT